MKAYQSRHSVACHCDNFRMPRNTGKLITFRSSEGNGQVTIATRLRFGGIAESFGGPPLVIAVFFAVLMEEGPDASRRGKVYYVGAINGIRYKGVTDRWDWTYRWVTEGDGRVKV